MNQDIISYIKNVLYDKAFLDIKRASSGNSKMGAFILASCFIDYMAGFLYGRKATGQDYKHFVSNYLPPIYNPSKLYKDLRCALVHNYSEGGSYWFKDNNPGLHGKVIDGRTIVNLENFIHDLENAFNKLMGDIQSDPLKKQKAIDRYNSVGILCAGGIAPKKT